MTRQFQFSYYKYLVHVIKFPTCFNVKSAPVSKLEPATSERGRGSFSRSFHTPSLTLVTRASDSAGSAEREEEKAEKFLLGKSYGQMSLLGVLGRSLEPISSLVDSFLGSPETLTGDIEPYIP